MDPVVSKLTAQIKSLRFEPKGHGLKQRKLGITKKLPAKEVYFRQ